MLQVMLIGHNSFVRYKIATERQTIIKIIAVVCNSLTFYLAVRRTICYGGYSYSHATSYIISIRRVCLFDILIVTI